jgi:hypothetical protein
MADLDARSIAPIESSLAVFHVLSPSGETASEHVSCAWIRVLAAGPRTVPIAAAQHRRAPRERR